MAFQFIRGKAVVWILFLCGLLGALLAFSFIPFSKHLVSWLFKSLPLESLISVSAASYLSDFGFVFMAFFLTVSLPTPHCRIPTPYTTRRLFRLSLLPILISVGYGFTKGVHFFSLPIGSFPWKEALWAWLLVPVGEELLFRGWLTRLLNRLYPESFFPFSPFLPLSIWGSALAFSFWHLQNIDPHHYSLVLVQLFYTFMIGIWLGLINWQTQKLWPCILAHSLLNFAADWKLLFMVI